jgi:hypothetical protein
MKYSKNQQDYINSVGGALAHQPALAIIGKLEMTIAMLLGAVRLADGVLINSSLNPRIAGNGPLIRDVIGTAIADAEKHGVRVVDNSQLLQFVQRVSEYTGEGPYTTPWQDIVRDLSQDARKVLGIKQEQPIKPEYQTIVYY